MNHQTSKKILYNSITNLSKEMARSYLENTSPHLFKEAKERFANKKENQIKLNNSQLIVPEQQNKSNEINLANEPKSISLTKFRSKVLQHRLSLQQRKPINSEIVELKNIHIKSSKPKLRISKSLILVQSFAFQPYEKNNNNKYKNNIVLNQNSIENKQRKSMENNTLKSMDNIQDNNNTIDDSMLLEFDANCNNSNNKLSPLTLKHNDAYYEKEKKFQKIRNRKIENLQKIKAEKEKSNCYPKPNINAKSKEIMNNKSREYTPIYQRGMQINSMKQAHKLINEKLIRTKEINTKKSQAKMPKSAIDYFIADQFEWKERIITERKVKGALNQIRKEMEINEMILKNELSKRNTHKRNLTENKSRTNDKAKASIANLSVYNRLYQAHEIKQNKMKLFQERMKPSFTPEINPTKHMTTINKANQTNKEPVYNHTQRLFNLKRIKPDYTSTKPSNNIIKPYQYKNTTQDPHPHQSRNKRNDIQKLYQALMFNEHKQIQSHWECELNSSSNFCINNQTKTKTKDKEPSWYNELELVSSAPTSNDCYRNTSNHNNKDMQMASNRLYKLNTENTTLTGKLHQTVILSTKREFNDLFQ